jgi:hypothetical protein
MSKAEEDVLRLLMQLEQAVRSGAKTDPKPDLLSIFESIDRATAQLPKGTDPTLLHYLHRKSYQKARLWLQGRESENEAGSCR